MRKACRFLSIFCSVFAFTVAAKAQITLDIGSTNTAWTFGSPIRGNNFESYLTDNGFTAGYVGASLSAEGPGTFSFEVIGSEAAYYNAFEVAGSRIYTSPGLSTFSTFNSYVSNGGTGLALEGTAEVTEAGALDNDFFGFRISRNGRNFSRFQDNESMRVVTLVQDTASLTGMNSVIFAFEDHNDSDFDDLIVRANFVPLNQVPEPETALLLLAGLGFAAARHRKAKTAAAA